MKLFLPAIRRVDNRYAHLSNQGQIGVLLCDAQLEGEAAPCVQPLIREFRSATTKGWHESRVPRLPAPRSPLAC